MILIVHPLFPGRSVLSVQVCTTGTPYKICTLTKDRYTTYTGSIDRYPGQGETVDLYATMNLPGSSRRCPADRGPAAGGREKEQATP